MHRGAGNLVLGDGSVQQATSVRLAEQVRHQDIATNRLLIPDSQPVSSTDSVRFRRNASVRDGRADGGRPVS